MSLSAVLISWFLSPNLVFSPCLSLFIFSSPCPDLLSGFMSCHHLHCIAMTLIHLNAVCLYFPVDSVLTTLVCISPHQRSHNSLPGHSTTRPPTFSILTRHGHVVLSLCRLGGKRVKLWCSQVPIPLVR